MSREPFVPPPYPHDRLKPIVEAARQRHGTLVDLSIGTPCDPPEPSVMDALADYDAAKGYPPSVGTPEFREAITSWFETRFGAHVPASHTGACVGTKELVAGLPHWLRLRSPERDTVLYPAVSYPTYEMGALLAGCRAVAVPLRADRSLDLDAIDPDDARRALCLWSNSPSNPTGALDDLGAVARWGRAQNVPIFSDECYVEFTWAGESDRDRPPGETILNQGLTGVVAVNSLSKRSNLAGLRVGFIAGDPDLVTFLNEVRKHSGLMVPGPAQKAAVVALADIEAVYRQRNRYRSRMSRLAELLSEYGLDVALPDGGFYLWIDAGDATGWQLTEQLAADLGVIVSPGDFYGPTVGNFIRVAAVQPDETIEVMAGRLRRSR